MIKKGDNKMEATVIYVVAIFLVILFLMGKEKRETYIKYELFLISMKKVYCKKYNALSMNNYLAAYELFLEKYYRFCISRKRFRKSYNNAIRLLIKDKQIMKLIKYNTEYYYLNKFIINLNKMKK
jgi:hypothetical protein